MRKRLINVIVFLALIIMQLSGIVNGHLSQTGNKYILHVWGSHQERGYAHGYLMASNIMNMFSDYFFTYVCGSSVANYNYYQQYHQMHFNADTRFVNEAQGILDGMIASGISVYHNGLQRNLNVNDILFVNAIVDISGYQQGKDLELGCSSLSSWGQSTIADPFLQGSIVITRLMDWNRNNTLIANPLLVVHHPSEPDERKWASLTYPGLFGALSAITDNGASAFLNMGNIHTYTDENNLSNILFDIRSGLERTDANNDGVHSTEDVLYTVSTGHHIGGTIIHSVQQWADSSQAAIIETNNSGTVRRLHNQYSNLNADNLAATNHFRMLYAPEACYRYSRIIDSLSVNPYVSSERQLTIMKGAGGVSNNLMMIQYQPSNGNILWSVATGTAPAYAELPLELNTDMLFIILTAISDEYVPSAQARLSVYPNPIKPVDQLNIVSNKQMDRLYIFNLRGQLIQTYDHIGKNLSVLVSDVLANYPSGVYLAKTEFTDGGSHTEKFLYLK